MRKALVIGINHYTHCKSLFGCVDDAHAMKASLARHADGSVNFDVRLFTGTGPTDIVTRSQIKDHVEELFKGNSDIALFYFAGHGHIETSGGYLVASDSQRGDDGMHLSEVLAYANKSSAKNKIIILDSCHSGIAGCNPSTIQESILSEGLTILTASTEDQYATEEDGRGLFTSLFVDALNGGAANILGEITPGSIYAYIDQSLGSWEQRPVFKTNVKSFVSLRKTVAAIQLNDIRLIAQYFPSPGYEFQLDPSFEPELKGRSEGMPPPKVENTQIFAILQKYNRLNLLIPVDVPHMWNAAMESRTCKLTALGEHYRRLVERGRI
jgi:hypothetical protein